MSGSNLSDRSAASTHPVVKPPNPFDSSAGSTAATLPILPTSDHIDGTANLFVLNRDADWLAIDATIIRWLFLTDDACTVWNKIVGLFTDNKLQRIVFLQQEFFGCHQNDSSVDAFCMRLKTLSDELNDIDFKVGDELLLSSLTAGLNEDLGNAASNLTLMANPTYERAVAYLRLEERRLKHLRSHAVHTAFAAGYSRGGPAPSRAPPGFPAPYQAPRPPAPSAPQGAYGASYQQRPPAPPAALPQQPPQQQPQQQQQQRQRCRGRGKGQTQQQQPRPGPVQQQPTPPWGGGHNPWTGFVHAYTMPVPRPPAPSLLGPGPSSHQAFFAGPQPGPVAPPAYYSPAPVGYGGPTTNTSVTGSSGYPAPVSYDPALLVALHQQPPVRAYSGGGDWFMDTAASSNMAAYPGNLSSASPIHTSSRIIVVCVRKLSRDNSVTVEFDEVGFSVKDALTRMGAPWTHGTPAPARCFARLTDLRAGLHVGLHAGLPGCFIAGPRAGLCAGLSSCFIAGRRAGF
nr:atrophin-1-like [Aegilops tauschii subsp. strangulata]